MNNMSNPYKTREGGATVTVFVPYDCNNHCPFCINKKEYADCSGFSLDAILRSIHTMDEITPRCDFVFTGGEPLADLGSLQKMLDAIPNTHRIFINTTFPVQQKYSADEMIAFTSQMAHVVSNAYIKSPTASQHKGFSAGSYKDMTRVAWLNAPMWSELFLENRDNMLHELDCLMDRLMEYRAAIAEDDAAALTQLLEDGKKRKEEVDGR